MTKIDFQIFDFFPELYFLLDTKLRITDFNKSASSFFTSENLTDADFIKIVCPSSIPYVKNVIKKALGDLKPAIVEIKLRNNSNLFDFQLFIQPIESDSQISFLIIAKNITEEKRKEIDLIRFYYVAQNTVNPLQITDTEGKMIYVNPAFEKASGYNSNELLGKNPNIFSSKRHTKDFWDNMWKDIKQGKSWIGEVENKNKNGESFFTELLISPIIDKQKKVIGYFGIHRDLSEKKALEKQLMHTQKMESIGTLAAGIAHEVGNPLASISAIVQIIQRTTVDAFINDKLELITKQVTRISKIIRDLVDFSRPSQFELQTININENLLESIDIVRVGKKAKDIIFFTNLDDTLPKLPLVGDQIQQVFVNILINAVDAVNERASKESKTLQREIIIETNFDKDNVYISFKDNGSGIEESDLNKVFEPFFTTKKVGHGTGLGLWVSYGIVKNFHGDVLVSSKKNEGTRFTIKLPIFDN